MLQALFPCFSLDSGINVHLYTVAARCRVTVVRRKALAVPRSADRQEDLLEKRRRITCGLQDYRARGRGPT